MSTSNKHFGFSIADFGFSQSAIQNPKSKISLRTHRTKAVLARKSLATGAIHLLLVAIAFTMVLPFVWMALTSLKTLPEVGLADWLPRVPRWDNYKEVFQVVPFGRFYFNSVLVAAWVTLLQVLTSSMAAFSFTRLSWPGRDKVFLLYL